MAAAHQPGAASMGRLPRNVLRIALAAALLQLAAAPAFAQGAPPARGVVAPAAPPSRSIDYCTCRAFGERFAPGERICLGDGESARLAECGMSTNVMNWRVLEEPCP